MLLETNRLIIEYFNTNDISDWAKIESDADVRRFVDGKVLSINEASEYVDDANFCHLTEESYAIIFVQRLTKLHESADKLKKRGYYKIYSKEYNADAIFKLRETLYRRLKDGNET